MKNEGKTLFFSSHELGEVETICDRWPFCTKANSKSKAAVKELATTTSMPNLEHELFSKVIGYEPNSKPLPYE